MAFIRRWKKCYHQLKDEFESYKLRREFLTPEAPLNVAISGRIILSKTAELDEEEIQNLKGQIVELRNRLSMVQTQLDQNRTTLAEYEAKEKELNETLGAQKQSFKEKLESQVNNMQILKTSSFTPPYMWRGHDLRHL